MEVCPNDNDTCADKIVVESRIETDINLNRILIPLNIDNYPHLINNKTIDIFVTFVDSYLVLKLIPLLLLSATLSMANPESYTIQSIRTVGIVELGTELTSENKTYRVDFPFKISTIGNSEFSGKLQHDSGIYIDKNSVVNFISIDKFEDYKATRPIIFLFMELVSGNMAYCSSDKLAGVYKLNLKVGQLNLIVGDESTFVILENKLYVNRGTVRTGDYIISNGQCTDLVYPIKVNKITDSTEELKLAIESCSAKTTDVANPQSPSDVQFFPPQPINPDIVSPSS